MWKLVPLRVRKVSFVKPSEQTLPHFSLSWGSSKAKSRELQMLDSLSPCNRFLNIYRMRKKVIGNVSLESASFYILAFKEVPLLISSSL